MPELDLVSLLPSTWVLRQYDDVVSVFFNAARGNHNRKAFQFKRLMHIDERFAEAMGLYAGDGDMHRKEKRHLTYVSIDDDIALFVRLFLRDALLVDDKDLCITVMYRDSLPTTHQVAAMLAIDESRVRVHHSDRARKTAYQLQVAGVVFRHVFELLYQHFFDGDYLEVPALRQAFLRGVFAAEGCVAVKYAEGFIDHLSISMSVKEEDVIERISRLLAAEGIVADTSARQRKNCIDLHIYNWRNFLHAWRIRLFDRCQRKRQTFLALARQSKVYGYLDQADLNTIRQRHPQKELARLIGSWQANVCRALQGRHLFTLRQIALLENNGMRLPVQRLRIGNLTDLPYDATAKELFGPHLLATPLDKRNSFIIPHAVLP